MVPAEAAFWMRNFHTRLRVNVTACANLLIWTGGGLLATGFPRWPPKHTLVAGRVNVAGQASFLRRMVALAVPVTQESLVHLHPSEGASSIGSGFALIL